MDESTPYKNRLSYRFSFVTDNTENPVEDGPHNISFCHMCQMEIPSAEEHLHLQSQCHEQARNELCAHAERILQIRDDAVDINSTMQQHVSGYGPWQHKIYQYMGRAVATDDRSLVKRAKELCLWYQHLERISLLELAVWKFCCVTLQQQQQPEKHDATTATTMSPPIVLKSLLEWKLWEHSGWKAYKKLHYCCNEVVVLMNAILPFLPYQQPSKKQQGLE